MVQKINNYSSTRSAALFVVSLVLFVSSQASAQTTVIASQDNLIDTASPTVVQDSTGHVRTKFSPERLGMFKFDLTDPDASASALVQFSVLDADPTTTYAGSFWALNAGWTATASKLGTDWDEAALHYENAPGMSTVVNGPDSTAMTQIGTFSVVSGTTPSIVVNIDQLSDYLQSDNTLTIAIFTSSQDGGNWLDWYSSETGSTETAPKATYVSIPEPSSYALLASMLGLISVMLRHRCD
jgi:outer membrane lipoprotein-sorting protein